ncbi:hypothetical protein BG005_007066 [Podila minutissima]|nr:hypothetical protein BG005_007066 [Podila minutissima]
MFTRRRRRRKRDLISNPVFSQPVMQENNRPGGGGSGGAVTGNIGKGRPTSQDAMMPSGFSNITAATGGDDRYGYGPETGAAVGGYAYDRQQQLQHRHGQLSYSPPSDHQRVNYTPPNEPEYPQSDMHNADYVQGRPQDDLAYHQYQQEQLYHQQIQMQLEQERLAATAAVTGYYPISRPSEYSPPISNVYPENPDRNPRYSEIEQERRLQRLLHGDPGSTGAYSNHISPAATPTANYQVQEQYQQLVTPSPQDYVDPESDVRYNESEPWVPPTTALPPTPVVVPKVVSSPIPASTSPIVSGKPIAMEAPQGSSLPLSTGSGKRPHAPQEFPEYKRGPQVLIPESIQSIEEVDRAHQQDLMRQQAQDPNTLSSEVMYTPPPPQ